MNPADSIVDEVRQVRQAYTARFNYDLEAIYRDLKNKRNGAVASLFPYAR